MIQLTTLTGLRLDELAERLDAQLPAEAYKAVPGGADLTDIDPNYMRKVLNACFGLCGVGWGYSYNAADMHTETQERSGANGKRTVQAATLKHLRFWYRMVDPDGRQVTCEIDASGGSENSVEGYAMKGAITNALGNAASNIGFQESVYLGKRDHKTVKKPAPAPKPASKAVTAPAVAPKSAEPAPAEQDPSGFVIPLGQRSGQLLGDQPLNVIEWYATQMAAGNSADKQALQAAAAALLKVKANGRQPVPA